MDEFDGFDDDDIDDSVLCSLPLEYPCEEENKDGLKDTDSGISLTDSDDFVQIPQKFSFPFEPYSIQVGFMQNLYKALELGKIGIFESPTGTGKSLSLICGALTWLRDHEEKQKEELEELLQGSENQIDQIEEKKANSESNSELDWIAAFAKRKEEDEKAKKIKEERELRLKRESRLKELRSHLRPIKRTKRKRETLEEKFDELFKDAPAEIKTKLNAELENCENQDVSEEDDIVVDEYHSDSDDNGSKNDSSSEDEDDGSNDEDLITKIYYCSRTHTQISQFIREVQKSPFGEDTRAISLGSRQNMCINESVKQLKSLSLINERCLELQKNKTATKKKKGETPSKKKKTSAGCPYYKQEHMIGLRDRALVDVKDIEQLVAAGRQIKACPYYSARFAIPSSQIVAVPYNTILHKSTRESCGIKLKGNVVIIDEAHNLLETISNIHSVEITGSQITCAYSQLNQYMERYKSRLKAKNLMYIKQILFILSSFVKYLGGKTGMSAEKQKTSGTSTRLQTINDFLFDTHLDNLNLFKVTRYCNRSMIAKKLHGFVEKFQPGVVILPEEKKKEEPSWALSKFLKEISQAKDNVKPPSPVPVENKDEQERAVMSSPLVVIQSFLLSLTNADKDGRILLSKQELLSHSKIKFVLLNPAVYFSEIVKEARSVIVAGGTMQPLSEFKDQLFFSAGASPSRILEYSCGHVVPQEQLLPIGLARGSSGLELDFTYQNRDTKDMMNELGRVMYNVCNIVPGGVVCFFPSYEYEKLVYSHWEKAGYLQKMSAKKKVFREPKKANQVDAVLKEYANFISNSMSTRSGNHTGAVLLCVVGGKMSEGINFSDDLGRCVLMVGLPYPNMRSPELKEKMDYLNATVPKGPDGKLPGQIYYENLCMKAVNQSIGRAIRHKEDYAAIMLLDHRYMRPGIRSKLPSWIGQHLERIDRFGPAFASLRKFFAGKKIC